MRSARLVFTLSLGVVLLMAGVLHAEWLFEARRQFEAGEWPDTAAAPIAVAFVPQGILTSVTPRVASGNASEGCVAIYDTNLYGELSENASYDVSGTISQIAFGLINSDKKNNHDLVVTTTGAVNGWVSVFLATNYGAFPAVPDTYVVGTNPRDIAIGQVDSGNTKNDIVVPNDGNDQVTVLINNGSGQFPGNLRKIFDVGDGPRSVALGLIDDDAYLDLVIAEENDGTLRVLFNTGDSDVFDPDILYATYSIGGEPYCVRLDDFDQDGSLDIVATTGEGSTVTDGKAVVLLNDGDGGFSVNDALEYELGYYARSVATGTFNSDSYPDIAVTGLRLGSVGDGESEWDVFVLINDADGDTCGFGEPDNYFAATPRWICAGELNHDSDVDLLVGMDGGASGNNFYRDAVTAFLGKGDGTFYSPKGLTFDGQLSSVHISDLNGDGDLDLLVSALYDDSLAIYIGDGDRGFERTDTFYAGDNPFATEAADLNKDTYPDLVTACRGTKAGGGEITIRYGTGVGSWSGTLETEDCGHQPLDLEIADFDGDTWLDIVVGSKGSLNNGRGGVAILWGSAQGFGPRVRADGPWSYTADVLSVKAGYIDDDAHIDLAATDGSTDLLWIYRGDDSQGLLSNDASFDAGSGALGVDVGDFNDDGWGDAVVACYSEEVARVFLADSSALWSGVYPDDEGDAYTTGGQPLYPRAEDVNSDGYVDLLVPNHCHDHHRSVTVRLGDGDGTFDSDVHEYGCAPQPIFLDVGDIDDDDYVDMVVAHETEPDEASGVSTPNTLIFFGSGEIAPLGPLRSGSTPPPHSELAVHCAPNPFAEGATLTFTIVQDSTPTTVAIYNVAGRLVRRVFEGSVPTGDLSVTWDGTDERRQPVASGVYFWSVVAGDEASSGKLVLMK